MWVLYEIGGGVYEMGIQPHDEWYDNTNNRQPKGLPIIQSAGDSCR